MKKNLYLVVEGQASEIGLAEASEICKREDYGQECLIITTDGDSSRALELAMQVDNNMLGWDNLSGQDAIQYGLIGVED